MTPFDSAMQYFHNETGGKWMSLNNILYNACNYADSCYLQVYGIGVWCANQQISVWKNYFKDFLIRNGVANQCAAKASSVCGKIHKLYCN